MLCYGADNRLSKMKQGGHCARPVLLFEWIEVVLAQQRDCQAKREFETFLKGVLPVGLHGVSFQMFRKVKVFVGHTPVVK